MVIQYPNICKVIKSADSTLGADGNYTTGEPTVIFETRCRIEPNSGNQFIVGSDGDRITFRSIVYMPLPVQLSSSYIPAPVYNDHVVYAGETLIRVITDEEEGGDTVLIPELIGKQFTLRMDFTPLIKDVEFEILPAGGFKIKGGAGTLISGQRFEIGVYYVFEKFTSSGISGVGGDFFIGPGNIVEVWLGNNLIVKETVKQFSKGQLNMRAWL